MLLVHRAEGGGRVRVTELGCGRSRAAAKGRGAAVDPWLWG